MPVLAAGGRGSKLPPARCRGSNFQFEPRQFRPQGETAESCGFCASCHPHQFPLKSFGFPGAETARKRFLLWEMGFPDAKISTRFRRARRFCRFSKSSKSVGLGRLENPLGFQPSRRSRFLCERAAALSRFPGGFGVRFASLLALTRGAGSRFASPLAHTRGWVALCMSS